MDMGNRKLTIVGALYTPQVALNILSVEQLKCQGYEVKVEGNRCTIHHMFEEEMGCENSGKTKEEMDFEGNEKTETEAFYEGNQIQTEIMEVDGNHYAIKVRTIQDCLSFLDLNKIDWIVYEYWDLLSLRFDEMVKWFHLTYLKKKYLDSIPPIIEGIEINLLGLHKMIESLGAYLKVLFGRKWEYVAKIHGLEEKNASEMRDCYRKFINSIVCYQIVMMNPRFKDEPQNKETAVGAAIGKEDANRKYPQGYGSEEENGADDVDNNTGLDHEEQKIKRTKFGVLLAGNEDDGEDAVIKELEDGMPTGKETTDSDDFIIIT